MIYTSLMSTGAPKDDETSAAAPAKSSVSAKPSDSSAAGKALAAAAASHDIDEVYALLGDTLPEAQGRGRPGSLQRFIL